MKPKRVVICWAGISGYLAACWRELAALDDIDLTVVTALPRAEDNAPFDATLLDGLPARTYRFDDLQGGSCESMAQEVAALRPDVVVVCGWFLGAYRSLAQDERLANARFLLAMDTPWRGALRQQVARLGPRSFLARMDGAFVASERTYDYALRLGFREDQIVRGVYGFDEILFRPVALQRESAAVGWPRSFLFVGRYVPEKGVDVLLDAYTRYRASVSDPWPLTCCGVGPLAPKNVPGVIDAGFRQPAELPGVFAQHAAFLLPSRYDPWGVVVAEALASAMPVVCSEQVGAGLDLVRTFHNGLVVPTGDSPRLAEALIWLHEHHHDIPAMGRRGAVAAHAYSAELWALRWRQEMLRPATATVVGRVSPPRARTNGRLR